MPRSLFPNTLKAVPDGVEPGTYVQDCVRVGDPPVQPEGDDDVTVRVCVLFDWQLPHPEYVNDVQVVEGGTYVQDRVTTGLPEHPSGDLDSTVRICVPFDWHALQEL